ncbi:MAG: type II toxin-antitoxin system VapC family toxin [Oxalobacteraceae bacterium]|jgi:predicted nucleic acid-binding protein|nr:type II toxin-antitoxin system VapC family toxin [Oxalobacteraceae bacterium]
MKYLLDTCVLSELVKTAPEELVVQWLKERKADQTFVSAITLAELKRGVAKLPESKRRSDLTIWLKQIESDFKDRILPFDIGVAHHWAEMTAQSEAKGKSMAALDSMIAATALAHGYHLVTRNVRDFVNSGVEIINPWETA